MLFRGRPIRLLPSDLSSYERCRLRLVLVQLLINAVAVAALVGFFHSIGR